MTQEDILTNVTTSSLDDGNNMTELMIEAELAEEEHQFDAISALALTVTIIGCLLLAYFVKQRRMYYLPERCVVRDDIAYTSF
jgi:hypothetical protein